jgi:hypothetical protein
MAAMTSQQINANPGLTPAFTTPTVSDTFVADDRTFLVVKTGGTGTTVGIATPDSGIFATADYSQVLGTSAERWIGPMTLASFANPTTGQVTVTYSSITTVTTGLFRL